MNKRKITLLSCLTILPIITMSPFIILASASNKQKDYDVNDLSQQKLNVGVEKIRASDVFYINLPRNWKSSLYNLSSNNTNSENYPSITYSFNNKSIKQTANHPYHYQEKGDWYLYPTYTDYVEIGYGSGAFSPGPLNQSYKINKNGNIDNLGANRTLQKVLLESVWYGKLPLFDTSTIVNADNGSFASFEKNEFQNIANENNFVESLSAKFWSEIQFRNNKELINSKIKQQLKEEVKKIKKNNWITSGISNMKVAVNFDMKEKTNRGYLNAHAISKFSVNISFDYNYKYYTTETSNEKATIANYLNGMRSSFQSSILRGSRIDLTTDVGSFNGYRTVAKSSSDRDNLSYLNDKLQNWYNTRNKPYQTELKYSIKSSNNDNKNNLLDVWIEFKINATDDKWQRFTLATGVQANWQFSSKYNEKILSKRLNIIGGRYLDLANVYNTNLVEDKPRRIYDSRDNSKQSLEWGGKWIYNAPVGVNFTATVKEDEILTINNIPIDVLNQRFETTLEDLKLKKQDDGSYGNNEYLIKLTKYDKSSINGLNKVVIATYEVVVIVNSSNPKLDVKWYAWDPDNDIQHKELISPHKLNQDGNVAVDGDGNKIANPNYDPLVDPQTGTKKELIWVSYKQGSSKLPGNTRFLQDPLGEDNLRITNPNLYDWGFIAEATLSGKGANLKIDGDTSQIKRFKINENNINQFQLSSDSNTSTNGTNIRVDSEASSDYFSYSGTWLFTSRTANGTDSYKVVSIGNNEPKELFTANFENEKVSNFWQSTPGIHLASYLKKFKNFTLEEVANLGYEEVLNYWKGYVDAAFTGKVSGESEKYVYQPIVNEEQIKTYALTVEKENFKPGPEQIKKFIGEFDGKNYVNWVVSVDENDTNFVKIKFRIKPNQMDSLYVIAQGSEEILIPVVWANQHKEDQEARNSGKKFINPSVNFEAVLEYSRTQTREEFFNKSFQDAWLNDFDDKDKIGFLVTPNRSQNNFILTFYVIDEFMNTHYIEYSKRTVLVPVEFISSTIKFINPFDGIQFNELNLLGLYDKKEVKDYIVNKLVPLVDSRFVYNEDWQIEHLDAKLDQLIKVQQSDSDSIDRYFLKLVVLPNGKNKRLKGTKIIGITNTISNINKANKISDLKTIGLSAIEVKGDTIKEIESDIITKLNTQLSLYDYQIGRDLSIKNLYASISALVIHKGEFVEFSLIGTNNITINETKVNVKLVSSTLELKLDLSTIQISKLTISETNPTKIKQLISSHLEKELAVFKIKLDIDYTIKNINDLRILKSLVVKQNATNKLILNILPKSKKVENNGSILIENTIKNFDYKSSKDWDGADKPLDDNLIDENEIRNSGNFLVDNPAHWGWLAPLIGLIIATLTWSGIKIKRKFIKAKTYK